MPDINDLRRGLAAHALNEELALILRRIENNELQRRAAAEIFYNKGRLLILEGRKRGNRDWMCDGLYELDASMSIDSHFNKPWIVACLTMHELGGIAELYALLDKQRSLGTAGSREKAEFLAAWVADLEMNGSLSSDFLSELDDATRAAFCAS